MKLFGVTQKIENIFPYYQNIIDISKLFDRTVFTSLLCKQNWNYCRPEYYKLKIKNFQ